MRDEHIYANGLLHALQSKDNAMFFAIQSPLAINPYYAASMDRRRRTFYTLASIKKYFNL